MLAPYYGDFSLGRTQRFGRRGLGFNRQTWEMGQRLGKTLKRKWDGIKREPSTKKRVKRSPSSRKQFVGEQIPTGGGDSRSSFFMKKKDTTKIGKLELENGLVVNNFATRVEATTGQQNAVNIGTYYTDADIAQHFALSNTAVSARVFLGHVHGESLITNQCNVNARIMLYDVLARRDASAGATDPLAAFIAGFADNSGGAAANYLVPGTTPFDNPRFTQWFKILKTTNVILSPGAVHSHVVHYSPSKVFSKEISNYVLSSSIGNLTLYTFMVFHGSPINDVTTQTQVSLAHIALDIVQKESYSWKYCATNSGVASVTQSLPLAFTVAGSTMQDDGVELAENEA